MRTPFYFSYYGNKREDMKYIKDYINLDNVNTIVEPFSGSCSFSLYVNDMKQDLNFHCNDKNTMLIRFLDEVKKDGFNSFIDYAKNKYEWTKELTNGKIQNIIGYKKNKEKVNVYDYFLSEKADNKYFQGHDMLNFIKTGHDRYTKTDQFFKKCSLTHHDYKQIFSKYKDDEHALLFIDPPYYDSKNEHYFFLDDMNDGKDNTEIFVDVIDTLEHAKCKIIFVVNKNAIMTHLYKNFIKGQYTKIYQMKKKKVKHLVITNF